MHDQGTARERLPFVDIAKAVAMLCIALGHFDCFAIDRVVFTFHVPLFYCISGYFISKRLGMADFCARKARTLLLPYYAIAAVILLVTLPRAFASGDPAAFVLSKLGAIAYAAGDGDVTPAGIEAIGALWFLWACFWGELFVRLALEMRPGLRAFWIAALFYVAQTTKDVLWLPLSVQAGAMAALYMYVAQLVRAKQDQLLGLPRSHKVVALLFALVVWAQFIWNFQTFWLVRADIGHGLLDVASSLCACAVVLAGCHGLQRTGWRAAELLARFGRHTLLFFAIHCVEMAAFPWGSLTRLLQGSPLPPALQLVALIGVRLVMDCGLLWLLLKSDRVRRFFGYEPARAAQTAAPGAPQG